MCTVTFVPHGSGYYLGMNRDENLARVPGLAPRTTIENGCRVMCPSEPEGGTWISTNERCVSLALINWYSVPGRVSGPARSRGEVIRSLRTAHEVDAVRFGLERLPLAQMKPFRLIGLFPGSSRVVEWRWNLKRLDALALEWIKQQWISSGFDEPTAQRVRNQTFQEAQRQRSVGTLAWLRRLHRCHTPKLGPFSTCMHRSDAATVSYTEISVSGRRVRMQYHAGAPCGLGGSTACLRDG